MYYICHFIGCVSITVYEELKVLLVIDNHYREVQTINVGRLKYCSFMQKK